MVVPYAIERLVNVLIMVKKGHLIPDCLLKKDSQAQKFEEGKSKPKTQGKVFDMTCQDAQASLDVVIGIVLFHSQ